VIGITVNHYRITAKLGEGGMGEVYRARDMRLERDVALKILPAHVANDPERLRRFQQEAQATAALSHPNILVVFDVGREDGTAYLVSELLEGETLRARLDNGPIPARKAIGYAAQIVKGLAAAHEKGILHRDLKPENIFITTEGVVKILDFGLAKLQALSAANTSASATVVMGSQPGTVLGTAAYMSPEQARGAAVDHRTDIFSFGCVLHEMLSGRRTFDGATSVETMHAILKNEPAALPDSVPLALARIAVRCLEKQPEERFQSARDLAFALEALSGTGESRTLPAASAPRRIKSLTAIGALMLLCLAAGASIAWVLRLPAGPRVVKLSILSPPDTSFEPLATAGASVLSPDDRSIVFVAAQNGRQMLWVRPLDSTLARSLAGTDGARGPFWSPDSRWIAFVSEGKLRKIEASGGPIQTLASVPSDTLAGASGTWNRDDVMLVSTSTRSALYRIRAAGGDLEPVTRLEGNETSHIGPAFLPDGRRFLFHVRSGAGTLGSVYAGSLDSKERKLLLSDVTRAVYAPSSRGDQGYLLYVRGTALVAHPFDSEKVTLAGNATALVDHVGATTGGTLGDFSVASNGVLSYQNADTTRFFLVSVDRTGKRLPGQPMREARVGSPRISPDGKRLAFFQEGNARVSDIWVHSDVSARGWKVASLE
jgi:eukaryotic-like serine/threonine-protein kinase